MFSPCLTERESFCQTASIWVYARPTRQMWPAGKFQLVLGNTAWFATIRSWKLGRKLCGLWGNFKHHTTWGHRSDQSRGCICPQYLSISLKLGEHQQHYLGGDGVPWTGLGPGAFRISVILWVHRSQFGQTAEDWTYMYYSSFPAKMRAEQRLG